MEDDDISIEAMRNWLKGVYTKDSLDNMHPTPSYDTYSDSWINLNNWTDDQIRYRFKYDRDDPGVIHLDVDPQKVEVEAWEPIFLKTWYPVGHPYRDYSSDDGYYIGHSVLDAGDRIITKSFDDDDYNLVTNNCSDATREALEAIFGKEADVIGFTTPGDVRDFAIENGGVQLKPHARLISIPMSKVRWDRLKRFFKRKKINRKRIR